MMASDNEVELESRQSRARQRRRSKRGVVIWLRRIHGWLGLWGAALGLLFGVSGFLLNHRAMMKIGAVRMDLSQVQLPLSEPLPRNLAEFTQWLQQALDVQRDPIARPPRAGAQEQRSVEFQGQAIAQPARWNVEFQLPQAALSVDYVVGNRYATVTRQDANALAFITRMHKGVGMNTGWVLLVDSLAGALIVLSVTGVLLWTKLRGSRLVMGALGLGSIALAVMFTLQSL